MRKRREKQPEEEPTTASTLRLIIALAIELEVEPHDLAATFCDSSECQTYYDCLLSLIEERGEQ